jgi:hypothetical protein
MVVEFELVISVVDSSPVVQMDELMVNYAKTVQLFVEKLCSLVLIVLVDKMQMKLIRHMIRQDYRIVRQFYSLHHQNDQKI